MATQQVPKQRNAAGKTVNIIFFMFSLGADDNWTTGNLSVGVNP
jgi:hypothetical protein